MGKTMIVLVIFVFLLILLLLLFVAVFGLTNRFYKIVNRNIERFQSADESGLVSKLRSIIEQLESMLSDILLLLLFAGLISLIFLLVECLCMKS